MVRDSSRLGFILLCISLLPGVALPARGETSWRPQGGEFQVNEETLGDQFHSAVASDGAGNVFVVWYGLGIRGRVYDASGLPLTGELRINSGFNFDYLHSEPKVAALGIGDFVVVWTGFGERGLKFRRFNQLGQPLSEATTVYDEPGEAAFEPGIAADPAGGFVLTWVTVGSQPPFRILAQRFDADGKPRRGAFLVSSEVGNGRKDRPRVAVDPASKSSVVTWIDEREPGNPDVWARQLTSSGEPQGTEFRVNLNNAGMAIGAQPIFHAGGFSVVWSNFNFLSQMDVSAQRFDAAGVRVGPEALLSVEPQFYAPYAPAVAVAPAGGLLVLWAGIDQRGPDAAVLGRLFDDAWRPAGEVFEVNTYVDWSQTEPAVTVDGRGNFTAVWSSGEDQFFPTEPPGGPYHGQDGSSFGLYGQRLTLAGCLPDDTRLCLGEGGRFAVQAAWKNPYSGAAGIAHTHPLTADTGALWFFDPANLEVMIKALDGRSFNGHFWIFYGALSNVEYTLTVTDTETGTVKTYHNPPLQFGSQADVTAFPAPPAAAVKSAPPARPAAPLTEPKTGLLAAGDCAPTSTAFCPQNRFRVQVDFVDPRTGLPGQGQAVQLTDDTGVFWFFAPSNLELMVKVLDGGGANGHFWVFYGALSDVEYTITVTDTATGAQKTYHNPLHHLASGADLTAFTAAR